MKVIKHGWYRHGGVGTLIVYSRTNDTCKIRFDTGETAYYPREVLDVMKGKVPG